LYEIHYYSIVRRPNGSVYDAINKKKIQEEVFKKNSKTSRAKAAQNAG
jgi:hypothetical protein